MNTYRVWFPDTGAITNFKNRDNAIKYALHTITKNPIPIWISNHQNTILFEYTPAAHGACASCTTYDLRNKKFWDKQIQNFFDADNKGA